MGKVVEFLGGLIAIFVTFLMIWKSSEFVIGFFSISWYAAIVSILMGIIFLFLEKVDDGTSLPMFQARKKYIRLIKFFFGPVLILIGLVTLFDSFQTFLPLLSLTTTPGLIIFAAIGVITAFASLKSNR